MLERWDEVLVQRYIDGREVNVGILGDTVLPIAEIDFGRDADGYVAHRHVSLEVGDRQRRGPRRRRRAARRDLPAKVADEVADASRSRAWRIVGGRATAAWTCASTTDGRPWILEVNANPDIAPTRAWRAWRASPASSTRRWSATICELGLSARATACRRDDWALAQRALGCRSAQRPSSICSPPAEA